MIHPVLVELCEKIPDQVHLLNVDDGDRVAVTVDGVTAYGTIGHMSLHWSTMKGINIYPVILDGTGQKIEVHARRLERV